MSTLSIFLLGVGVGVVVTFVAALWTRRSTSHDAATIADHVRTRLQETEIAGRTAAAQLDSRLASLGTDLGRITGLMRQLETSRAEQYGDLSRHLEHTLRTTTELAATTQNLREVLGSSTARGQWGERMADDILRAAGLLPDVNYVRGQRLPSGSVPDITFLLPQGRRLHMDVKFPIMSYIRYVESRDEKGANHHAAQFIRDARNRIREVATRDYVHASDGMGLALLLIPNEGVFTWLQQQAPEMFDDAMKANIAMCSPLTLFPVLAVIRHCVDSVRLAEQSSQIRAQIAAVKGAWQGMCQDLDRLGTHLRNAASAYDSVAGAKAGAVERSLAAVGGSASDEAPALRHTAEVKSPS